MVQLVIRRLDRFEASTMTWLIRFLRLSVEGCWPTVGEGTSSCFEGGVPPPAPLGR